jgi:hypothetical protein
MGPPFFIHTRPPNAQGRPWVLGEAVPRANKHEQSPEFQQDGTSEIVRRQDEFLQAHHIRPTQELPRERYQRGEDQPLQLPSLE